MRIKSKWLCILIVLSSTCSAAWKTDPSGTVISSDPIYQKTKTGGLGQATFMMMKGSISYMTSSATSWCSDGSIFTSIEGDEARWLFERLWKQRYVVIDGWNVDTTGFQQAVRQLPK